MKKVIIAGLVGGIILFIWSFLAWVVLPLHSPSLHAITNEDAIIQALQQTQCYKGVYQIPHNPGSGASAAEQQAWMDKMKRGPVGLIIYNPAGTDPMMPKQMIIGFVIDLLSALLVAWLLTRSTAFGSSYLGRVAFCAMFALFATFFDYLTMWNWMGFARDFTMGLIIDSFIAWILAGLGIAAIMKAPKAQQA